MEDHLVGRVPRPQRGFTLVEIASALGIVLSLAAIATPSYLHSQLRAKRAELATNVRGILDAERVHWGQHSELVIAPLTPPSPPSRVTVPWTDPTQKLDELGYAVDGSVYCRYMTADVATQSPSTATAQQTNLQNQIATLNSHANTLSSMTPTLQGDGSFQATIPPGVANAIFAALGLNLSGISLTLAGTEGSILATLQGFSDLLTQEAALAQADLDALTIPTANGVVLQVTGICDLDGDGTQIEHSIFWNPSSTADYVEFRSWTQSGAGNTW